MLGLGNRSRLSAGICALVILFVVAVGFELLPIRSVGGGHELETKPMSAELVTAIRNGDTANVSKLIEGGEEANARDVVGNTPLILASFYAGPNCVELLLKKGADPNGANNAGVTALIRGATNYEIARLLLAAGAKTRHRTAGLENTPLILAARRAGNSKTVKLLLEHRADANETNAFGTSPLMAAAAGGDLESVKVLLGAKADVNYYPKPKDSDDTGFKAGMRTALMWAAYRNDAVMVELLLKNGADPNQATYHGTPLSHACWHNSLAAAERLIANGAKVNSREKMANFTPLHWAAGTDSPRPDLVKLLLAKGAEANAAGGEPIDSFVEVAQTPRLIAERRGRTAIVEALAAAGATAPGAREKAASTKLMLPKKLDDSILISSAERAVAVLQSSASKSHEGFLQHASKQNCTSCHQQYLPMAAVGHARERSVRIDRDAAREQTNFINSLNDLFFNPEFIAQLNFHPEPAHTFGYELFGLYAEKVQPCVATDVRLHQLVAIQASDGRWFNNLPRPPLQSSDVSATALVLQAIKRYGWLGRKAEFAACVERAQKWLWHVNAETTEDAIFQLLGLHWAGEPAGKLEDLARKLLEKQRADGGWPQLPTLESDAYATGQALYALAQSTKHGPTDAKWQSGLRFLLETQQNDGSWHVVRRAFPIQPTMRSGFPHHRDGWISAAGTSWAVLAITRALPPGEKAGKPEVVKQPSEVEAPKGVRKVDFARQIKPLLERSCVACHGPDKQRNAFRVDSRKALLNGGESGAPAIVPGHGEKSQLIEFISGRIPESEMPPKNVREKFPALTKDEVTLLRAWIDQGAEWPKDAALNPPKVEK